MRLTDVNLLVLLGLPSLDEKMLVGVLFRIIVVLADASILGADSVKHALGVHSFDKRLALAIVADETNVNGIHFLILLKVPREYLRHLYRVLLSALSFRCCRFRQ